MENLSDVLPPSARTNPAGHLEIAGCDTVELAERFGTPLFVYDEDFLNARLGEYRDAFMGERIDGYVAYASKAFSCLAMARLVADSGLWMDVSTGGELAVALAGGFPAERLVVHGNNKSVAEIEAAVVAGAGRIVIDSLEETDRIDAAVQATGTEPVTALLRLTPGIDPDTHAYIRTGQEDSKFGLGISTGQAHEAVKRLAGLESIRLVGVHSHIGSQIFDLGGFEEAVDVLADFAHEASDTYGSALSEFNLGGGLGIAYLEHERTTSVAELADVLWTRLTDACDRHGLPAPRIGVEPGRSLVGRSAVTLYSVGVVKELPGIRTYVAVDGGMSDNMRPSLYDAGYETLLASRPDAGRDLIAHVAGKHCETGDILVEDASLPSDVQAGDVLVTPATGAYGYAMANNYNLVHRPAVVFASHGEARLVIRRETDADLMSLME